MTEVSVIIPVYNNEEFIYKSLQSLKRQVFRNFEAIIINDGSTDKTKNIILSMIKDDERFKLINIENKGQGIARYIGIKVARGRYATFLDGDDFVKPTWLSQMVSDIRIQHADMVCINYAEYYEKSEKYIKNGFASDSLRMNASDFYKEWCIDKRLKGFLWNKIFRMDLMKKCNEKLEFSFMEDSYLLLKFLSLSKRIFFDRSVEYFYRIRKLSTINATYKPEDLVALKKFKSIITFQEKNNPHLKYYFEMRFLKIELLILMRMNLKQLQSVDGRELLEDFTLRTWLSRRYLVPFFNKIDTFIIQGIRGPKSALYFLKMRSCMVQIQRIYRSHKNSAF